MLNEKGGVYASAHAQRNKQYLFQEENYMAIVEV